jgi:putative membrane protein
MRNPRNPDHEDFFMKHVVTLTALSLLATIAFADEGRNMDTSLPPNDSEIAQIVLTANSGEIAASKIAVSKSKNADVKELAGMMITDHKSVTDKTTALAKKLNVKPKMCAASKELAKDSAKNTKKLSGLKGADFDKEYVDQMVMDHQNVLDTIDKTLLPNAKNEELKNLIASVRPAVATHLEHAKLLQAKLKGPNSG